MSDNIMRAFINSVLPKGSTWEVMPDGDLDKLLDGKALNIETVRLFLKTLADIRNPLLTPILCDLEKEYGIACDERLTEAERRQRLYAKKYNKGRKGTKDDLQKALTDAGFDVQVHINNPPVDPAIFLSMLFLLICNGANAYAGEPSAVAGFGGGELLVNGDFYTNQILYDLRCGSSIAYAGAGGVAGQYSQFIEELVNYEVPTDPESWCNVFFVGGDATRDTGTGELTAIARASIPRQRREEFRETILRIKPLRTWAGLIVEYI